MIYELRLYTVVPGRIDVALTRFRDYLPSFFLKHRIRNVGRWIASAGPAGPMFAYLMAYDSLAEREQVWDAFYADPEWNAIRSLTQGDEEATERFDLFLLKSHPTWQPQAPSDETIAGTHDLLLIETALGQGAALSGYLADAYLPALSEAGASIMLVADLLSGAGLPKLAIMLAWDDANARARGWQTMLSDERLNETIARQRRTFGRPLLGRVDTYMLEPTVFALPLRTLGYR